MSSRSKKKKYAKSKYESPRYEIPTFRKVTEVHGDEYVCYIDDSAACMADAPCTGDGYNPGGSPSDSTTQCTYPQNV